MIALITPTGSRQAQFDLCQKWMNNQTYTGEVVWVIVDDCYPRTTDHVTDGFKDKWAIIKVYPTPIWNGQNTQARNIKAGVDTLVNFDKIEAIFIIEDDDYYRPVYLERMMANFGAFDLIGERNTIYYNVQWRKYVTNPNTIHASLFQTAFTVNALPFLEQAYAHKFIDCLFWKLVPNRKIFYEHDLAIGMKGMSGRGGIGAGHSRSFAMKDDSNLAYLRSLIGEDAKFYETYYINQNYKSHLFTKR